jgi:predicted nucleic acid-binding protein
VKNGKPVYYWDSCLFLTVIRNEKHVPNILQGAIHIQSLHDKYECYLLTSVLVDIEVLEAMNNQKAMEVFRGILRKTNSLKIAIDSRVINLARDIRNKCKQANITVPRVPDAIHVATGILYKVDEFHTSDNGIIKISPLLQDEYNIRVCNPPIPKQGSLILLP